MRDSFVFYKSFAEAIKVLPDEERLQLFDGLVAYALDDVDPNFEGVTLGMFTLIKPQIDANNRKYENGKKGGRKPNDNQTETKPKPNHNQDVTKAEPNVNVNVNDNENVNVNVNASAGADVWSLSRSVLSFLNEAAGTSYRTDAADSVKLISALSHKGYTEDQMRAVVEKMTGQWLGDPKMEQYLRPSTLFKMSNFEKYLQAPDSARKRKQDEEQKREQNKARYREAIRSYQEQISAIDEQMKGAGVAEKVELRGQKAVLEARLNDLERATS